jgi:hypothetical protein
MTFTKYYYPWIAAFVCSGVLFGPPAGVQATQSATQAEPSSSIPNNAMPGNPGPSQALPTSALFDFKDSDIKFSLQTLMTILRDQRHEGWVLTAYPDPHTHRPLIGAGFSLDVPATDHPQTNPLNPHPFSEPSSAQLWQAAGLNPALLQDILQRFDDDMKRWTIKQYRRKLRMHTLGPDLTEEEATRLLRISAIQAVYNARAYCRYFDQLTGPQQLALSQLVFQMGVNLQEFIQFLVAINGDSGMLDESLSNGAAGPDSEHWRAVQTTLIDSQWARLYSGRAATVIAMFDPTYANDPMGAEGRVEAALHPPSRSHRHRRSAAVLRTGSSKGRSGKSSARQAKTIRKRRTT